MIAPADVRLLHLLSPAAAFELNTGRDPAAPTDACFRRALYAASADPQVEGEQRTRLFALFLHYAPLLQAPSVRARTARLQIRVTPDELERVTAAAREAGVTVATFVRQRVLRG
jgi:hypothetical protein